MDDEAVETPEEQLAKQHRKEKKEMQGSSHSVASIKFWNMTPFWSSLGLYSGTVHKLVLMQPSKWCHNGVIISYYPLPVTLSGSKQV